MPAYDELLPDMYRPDTEILEIGCGEGLVARHFVRRGVLPQNITGIDPSSKQIANARQSVPGVTFIESSAENFEPKPESLDLVVMNTVMHHLDGAQLEAMLERVYAGLKPGGTFFFVDVDPDQSAESFDADTINTWKDVQTPWGTRVPFFSRSPHGLFDALDRHGFDMVAGGPLRVPPEAQHDDPVQYAHYTSRPSRIAGRFQKVPPSQKMPRYYGVKIPGLSSSPDELAQAKLVADYFAAWGGQSLDVISRIFTADAVYDEKPGRKDPLTGIDQIVRYWRANPMSQNDIATSHSIIGRSPDEAVWAEFSAKFYASVGRDVIHGCIKFDTDPATNQIKRLTEWFDHI